MLEFLSRFKNLQQGIARLSRRQRLLTGAMLVAVLVTWLAVCALLVILFA